MTKRSAWAVIGALLFMSVAVVTPASALEVALTDADALKFNRTNGVTLVTNGISGGSVTAPATGQSLLYKNVGNFGGIAIDAVVTVVDLNAGATISNFDNPGSASTTGTYLDNFQINTSGTNYAQTILRFEFFRTGSYTGTGTGIPVTLKNVKITSIDLDTSGTAGFQYSDFSGFQKYSMMSPTNLAVQAQSATAQLPARTRFIAAKTGARSSVPEDQVMVRYDAVQKFTVAFGANTTASTTNYFGLVFGGWPNGGTPVEYTNANNLPPTSTDDAKTVAVNTYTTITRGDFGVFSDPDDNPFVKVKILTPPSKGRLQYYKDSAWTDVAANAVVTTAEVDAGSLRFDTASATSLATTETTTVEFQVQDGLDYSTSSYTLTLTANGQGQSITFTNPGTRAPSLNFAANATASSGLLVTLTTNTPGVCTVSSDTITTTALGGTCSVTATQGGNDTYTAATPVTQDFLVSSKTQQTITLTLKTGVTTDSSTATETASSSSGESVILTSLTPAVCSIVPTNIVKPIAAGTCTVRATQPGNSTFDPATPVERTITITQGTGTSTGPVPTTLPVETQTSGWNVIFPAQVATSASTDVAMCNSSSRPSSDTNQMCSNSKVKSQSSVSSNAAFTYSRSGISTGKTYYYQALAKPNGSGTYTTGRVLQFTPGGPVPYTDPATSISASGATLQGRVQIVGSTSWWLCYSTSDASSFGRLNSCDASKSSNFTPITGTGTQSRSLAVTGLRSGTKYYFQMIAKNATGTNQGAILSFQTLNEPPAATTMAATSVTRTSATINGNVNSKGLAANVTFVYSESSSALTSDTASVNAVPASITSTSPVGASVELSGLVTNKRYYYRVVATTSAGTSSGDILSFFTGAPIAITSAATSVDTSSAVLNGIVKAQGVGSETATVQFRYSTSGTVDANGALSSTPTVVDADTATATGFGNTSAVKTLTATSDSLTVGQIYYFQTVSTKYFASDSVTVYGAVQSFVLATPPSAATQAATSVSTTGAVLNGTVSANGAAANVWFCFGKAPTQADGALSSCQLSTSVVTGSVSPTTANGSHSETATLTGLVGGTKYYFQIVAENALGTTYGAILDFVTLADTPTVTTLLPTVSATGATLRGTANGSGSSVTPKFCWGTSSATNGAGALSTCTTVSASPASVSGNSDIALTASTPNNLVAGTTYYYQARVETGTTFVYGDVVAFKAGAPTTVTSPATGIGSTTATLNGSVKRNGSNITAVQICLDVAGDDDANGLMDNCFDVPTVTPNTATPNTVSGDTETAVAYAATGLTPGTLYFFQVKATNGRGSTYGDILTFSPGTPFVTTYEATNVQSDSAELNGYVDIGVEPADEAFFCLSDSPLMDGDRLASCGKTQPIPLLSSDTLTATPIGLDSNTKYYFQVAASNSRGVSYGKVKTFVTAANQTKPATVVTATTANINGRAASQLNDAKFCVSTDDPGDSFPLDCARTGSAPDTATAHTTGAVVGLAGLSSSTTYYFQFFGKSQANDPWSGGAVLTFITLDPGAPSATTNAATSIGQTSATLNGLVGASNASTTVTFCLSTSATPDPLTGCIAGAVTATPGTLTGDTQTAVSLSATGLTAGTTYYFQVIATNATATTYGTVLNFTTTAAASGGGGSRGGGGATAPTSPTVKKLPTPTRVLPKKDTKADTSVKTTEKKSAEAKLAPVVAKVTAPSTGGGGGTTTAPALTLDNVTVLPEIKEQVAKQVKLEETKDGLKVTPVDGFTGKLVVPVITVANNEEVEVLTEVVVNPEPVPTGQATPESIKKSTVTWAPSTSQVVEYVVEINGKEACKTTGTSCDVSAVVGPKTKVEVTAIGNDQTESEVTAAQYKALQLIAAAKVQFAESSAKLRPAAKKVLQNVAKIIVEAGFTQIAIEGHTDSQGGQKNASPLSKARAVATQKYLDSLLPERLTVKLKASGLSKPVASNDTKAGQAQNRRAEVLVK